MSRSKSRPAVRRAVMVGAVATVVSSEILVGGVGSAGAHFTGCGSWYYKWPGNSVWYYSDPTVSGGYATAYLNAENSYSPSGFDFWGTGTAPWNGGPAKVVNYVDYANPGPPTANTYTYGTGCDLTAARIEFHNYHMASYPVAKKQSTAVHEQGHAIGMFAEVLDGCTLATLQQGTDSCRWDVKGINTPTAHDTSEISWVY